MSKPDITDQLKNVSKKDIDQIKKAQEMLGPDPETMGFIKNIYWGNLREDMIFPYPEESTKSVSVVTSYSKNSTHISRTNIQQ